MIQLVILVMWNRRVVERFEDMVGSYSVSTRRKGVEDGFDWACSRVYGPNDDSRRFTLG